MKDLKPKVRNLHASGSLAKTMLNEKFIYGKRAKVEVRTKMSR
jgi:hypothetical protein